MCMCVRGALVTLAMSWLAAGTGREDAVSDADREVVHREHGQ